MKPVNVQPDPTSKLRKLYDIELIWNSFEDVGTVVWFHQLKLQITNSMNVFEYIKPPIWNQ